jgi:hypothetical protein
MALFKVAAVFRSRHAMHPELYCRHESFHACDASMQIYQQSRKPRDLSMNNPEGRTCILKTEQ